MIYELHRTAILFASALPLQVDEKLCRRLADLFFAADKFVQIRRCLRVPQFFSASFRLRQKFGGSEYTAEV